MTKKAKRGEILALRVMYEQRWAYERTLEHLTYHEMRLLVSRPEPVGLGYDLSEHQLKGLVAGYRDRMADVEERSLDEHRERELADLDRLQRRATAVAELAAAALTRGAEREAFDVHAAKALLEADAKARAIGESRRKLLGLDAPQQIKADVTVRDAVTDELNEMLARAGRPPIEVSHD